MKKEVKQLLNEYEKRMNFEPDVEELKEQLSFQSLTIKRIFSRRLIQMFGTLTIVICALLASYRLFGGNLLDKNKNSPNEGIYYDTASDIYYVLEKYGCVMNESADGEYYIYILPADALGHGDYSENSVSNILEEFDVEYDTYYENNQMIIRIRKFDK